MAKGEGTTVMFDHFARCIGARPARARPRLSGGPAAGWRRHRRGTWPRRFASPGSGSVLLKEQKGDIGRLAETLHHLAASAHLDRVHNPAAATAAATRLRNVVVEIADQHFGRLAHRPARRRRLAAAPRQRAWSPGWPPSWGCAAAPRPPPSARGDRDTITRAPAAADAGPSAATPGSRRARRDRAPRRGSPATRCSSHGAFQHRVDESGLHRAEQAMHRRGRALQRLIEAGLRLCFVEHQTEQHHLGRLERGIDQQRLAGETQAVVFLGLVGGDSRRAGQPSTTSGPGPSARP